MSDRRIVPGPFDIGKFVNSILRDLGALQAGLTPREVPVTKRLRLEENEAPRDPKVHRGGPRG